MHQSSIQLHGNASWRAIEVPSTVPVLFITPLQNKIYTAAQKSGPHFLKNKQSYVYMHTKNSEIINTKILIKVLDIYFPNLYLIIFYCCLNTVVSIFPPPFSPTPPTSTSHPQSYPPLALSMGPLCMFLDGPSPSLPCSPTPLPLGIVNLFFISMSLVIFCLLVCFVDQVPVTYSICGIL